MAGSAYVGVGQGYGLYVLSGGPNYTVDGAVLSQRLLLALALSCIAIFFNRIPKTHRKIAAYAPVKARALMAASVLLAFVLVPLIAVSGPVRVTRPATAVAPLCDRGSDRSA